MQTVVRGMIDQIARAVRWVVVLLAIVMLVTLSLQVFLRYVFGNALSWSEELALTCFSWSMLLAIALGVRDAIHVRMDLLIDRLPAHARAIVERLLALVIAAAGFFIAWSGVNYVIDAGSATSAAIGYPTAYLYACAPVCGALIALFALEHVIWGPPAGLVTQPE